MVDHKLRELAAIDKDNSLGTPSRKFFSRWVKIRGSNENSVRTISYS